MFYHYLPLCDEGAMNKPPLAVFWTSGKIGQHMFLLEGEKSSLSLKRYVVFHAIVPTFIALLSLCLHIWLHFIYGVSLNSRIYFKHYVRHPCILLPDAAAPSMIRMQGNLSDLNITESKIWTSAQPAVHVSGTRTSPLVIARLLISKY